MSEKLKKLGAVLGSGKFWAAVFAVVAIGAPTIGKELEAVSEQVASICGDILIILATVTATLSESPITKDGE